MFGDFKLIVAVQILLVADIAMWIVVLVREGTFTRKDYPTKRPVADSENDDERILMVSLIIYFFLLLAKSLFMVSGHSTVIVPIIWTSAVIVFEFSMIFIASRGLFKWNSPIVFVTILASELVLVITIASLLWDDIELMKIIGLVALTIKIVLCCILLTRMIVRNEVYINVKKFTILLGLKITFLMQIVLVTFLSNYYWIEHDLSIVMQIITLSIWFGISVAIWKSFLQ